MGKEIKKTKIHLHPQACKEDLIRDVEEDDDKLPKFAYYLLFNIEILKIPFCRFKISSEANHFHYSFPKKGY